MSSNRDTGYHLNTIKANEQAWLDAQTTITRCAFCDWTYAGTALEGRQLAAGHRRVHHPTAKMQRRRRPSLNRFVSYDDGYRSEGLERAEKVASMLTRRDNG